MIHTVQHNTAVLTLIRAARRAHSVAADPRAGGSNVCADVRQVPGDGFLTGGLEVDESRLASDDEHVVALRRAVPTPRN